MRIRLERMTDADAEEIARLRTAAADELRSLYGPGHWALRASEKGVLGDLRTSAVFVARRRNRIVATLRLAAKKPWAIDTSYFSEATTPLYLTNMAVDPASQREGIGRACMAEAERVAVDWPADAIRLDAYDADAGAGEFYRKCGFREVGRVSYRGVPLIYFERMIEQAK